MSLAFSVSGSGYPIVLLHGFGEDRSMWQKVVPSLAQQFKVFVPDLPGFGKTPLELPHVTIENVANEVYEWLLEHNIAECAVFGHSLGGYVALAMAEAFPNIFSCIGLINSTALADSKEKKENRLKTVAFLDKHGSEKFMQSFLPTLFYPPNREPLQPIIDQMVQKGALLKKQTLVSYTLAMRERPDRTALFKSKNIQFLAGTEDTTITKKQITQQKDQLPQEQVILLEDCGHVAPLEKPTICSQAMATFASHHGH